MVPFISPIFLFRQAVREIPVIKYTKRLGNQVLASLSCLEMGCNWFGKDMKLVIPNDDTGTEEEMRPYLEVVRTPSNNFAVNMCLSMLIPFLDSLHN